MNGYEEDSLIPTSVLYVNKPVNKSRESARENPMEATQWIYTERKSFPLKDAGSFSLEFDENTKVVDHADGRVYMVGMGLENDKASVKRFMIEVEGETPKNTPAPTRRRWTYSLIGFNLIIVAVVGVVLFRKRRKTATGLLLFCLVLGSWVDGGFASEGLAIKLSENSNTGAASSKIPRRQCGHLVAMASLFHFGIDPPVELVENELKPAPGGVSLS